MIRLLALLVFLISGLRALYFTITKLYFILGSIFMELFLAEVFWEHPLVIMFLSVGFRQNF